MIDAECINRSPDYLGIICQARSPRTLDAADAEAICEAAQRPTMRFVAVKSEDKQASAVIFRTRDVLVGQRTQLVNLTCHWFVIQRRLEPRQVLRRVARWEQRAIGGAGRGCAADRSLR